MVDGGRILKPGSYQRLREEYNPREELDLEGKTILPGFIDAHVHFVQTGLNLMGVDLVGALSKEEMLGRVRKELEQLKPGALLLGNGYDQA